LILSQILLVAAIFLLGFCNPASTPWYVPFGAALLVATASATQDIVVDAFRIESLPKDEQAAGMASYVAAYRISTLISTAGALFLIDAFEKSGFSRGDAWKFGYAAMAALIVVGMVTVMFATEPDQSRLAAEKSTGHPLQRVFATTRTALMDFLTLDAAAVILVFVVLFKFTDAFSGIMTEAFVIDIGFSKTDYAAIVKGVGLAATLIGGFAGGFVARRYSLAASLWIGGVLQAVANLSFSWLALAGVNQWALAFAITAENFTSAIGTVIFVAYLSALCRNPLHTATQYALLTALAAVGRTYLSSGAGYVAKAVGWPLFFVICVVVAVPSLILLAWLQRRGHFAALGPVRV
jgi:PAT family beta-lactamase induction signal transducer AmpG